MIYLDNNATTRPAASVVEAVNRALTEWWENPSSIHRPGQAARQQLELARRELAELIAAKPREIIFLSGGTESIDLALRGALLARRPTQPPAPPILVTTKLEHAAVRDLVEDLASSGHIQLRWAHITSDGLVDLEALDKTLQGAAIATIQWVNNETGAIQPVTEIAHLCRQRGTIFHCDATQWVGKEPTDVNTLNVDLLTFSPHKFHGPKGVGILWARRGVRMRPAIHGTQELGRRGGTENVPGICGAAAAAREARLWLNDPAPRQKLAELRDHFEQRIRSEIPDARINGPRNNRIWNTTNIGFPRLEAEALLLMLSERGLCASAGAACSSGSLDPSPVLLAMGIPPEVAHGSLRFTLSRETTPDEIDAAVRIITDSVRQLRQSLPVAP